MTHPTDSTAVQGTPGHHFEVSSFWRTFPARMRRRWWMFRPLDVIARHWPVLRRRRGLLVVRMDGIGDMVLFRPALDAHAEAFGIERKDITVLGCDSWGPIAREIFEGYRVVTLNEHAYARRPLYRFKINLLVRGLAPEVAVCDSYLRRALMADSLVWVSGAKRTVVSLPYINEPTRPEYTHYLSQVSEIVNTGVYPTHEVVRHFRFVSQVAGREIAPVPPRISWPERTPPIPEGAPYVVLNPGSNEPGRRWPFASYLEIGERLLEAGYRVVFVGSRAEKPDEELLGRFSQKDGVIDLFGKTSLPELMDVMKHAAAMLTNDTGPAHLSIALGTPTLVVVGGGHFGSFVPYPAEVSPPNARFVFEEIECYHCFWRCDKRPTKHDVFPCIAKVPEDKVWAEMGELLGQTG